MPFKSPVLVLTNPMGFLKVATIFLRILRQKLSGWLPSTPCLGTPSADENQANATDGYVQHSFVGWFFKRVGCGFFGAHFSLIFFQIQQFLSKMLRCLALPRFTCRFYVLIILLSLCIPWSNIDFFSSGFDVIHSQALLQPRCPVHIRNVARSQCRSSRCHT